MSGHVDVRTLFRTTVPVAGIMFCWSLGASVVPGGVATTGAQVAGVLLAGLYVLRSGPALTVPREMTARRPERAVLLRENVAVAVAVGAWFSLAFVAAYLLELFLLVLYPLTAGPIAGLHRHVGHFGSMLAFVFVVTGVFTVATYVVAVVTLHSDDTPASESTTAISDPTD